MQVEFSFHLLAYFQKEEFLMTLKTSALHSVLFVALVFQGMLEIFTKSYPLSIKKRTNFTSNFLLSWVLLFSLRKYL